MTKTNTHIECIGDPYFKAVGDWTGAETSGTQVAGAGILTLTNYNDGVITADMGYAIDDLGELYHWEIWLDSINLASGTLTVTAGGKTLKALTAAGKFSGTILPDATTALKITTSAHNVDAVLSRISVSKHGHGRNI